MTRKEVNHLLQIARDSLGRASSLTQGEKDLRLLHLAVILDAAQNVTYATLYRFGQWLYATPTRSYLSVFDKLNSELEGAFRTLGTGVLPRLSEVAGIPKPVKYLVKEAADDTVEAVSLLGRFRQMFAFPLRYNFPGAEDVTDQLLEINATRDHKPSETLKEIARDIIDENFISDVGKNFLPRHGNGSVSWLRGGVIKSRRMSAKQKDALLDIGFIRETFLSFAPIAASARHLTQYSVQGPISPSKVISVPKTWKKRRIVAVEDVTRMWLQQGLRAGLVAAIAGNPRLCRHIDFQRPELNRDLARFGSYARNFATIDLSSASDCVGTQFVEELFGNTPLWPLLNTLRTQSFSVEEHGVIESHIFATMGNAICFPVMTMVLTMIVLEAVSMCQLPENRVDFAVYGDDIVVPEVLVPNVLRLLTTYGFVPNKDKTFSGSDVFRESCGGEYIFGKDITPIRISRKFQELSLRAGSENLFAISDLANACRWYLPSVRRICLEVLSERYKLHLPATQNGELGVASDDPRQFMQSYPSGWYAPYQYPYWEVQWPKVRTKTFERNSEVALLEWLAKADALSVLRACVDGFEQPLITSTAQEGRGVSVRTWWLLGPIMHLVRPRQKGKRSE